LGGGRRNLFWGGEEIKLLGGGGNYWGRAQRDTLPKALQLI
jgi:hypothetical protein